MILPPGEKIVETKKCRLSGKEFFVTDKDLEFYNKISPIFGWKKYSIPSPTLCPVERARRRLAFRNPKTIYLRKSSFSDKTIFSQHSIEKPYPVYENEIYYGNDWSPLEYGANFTTESDFLSQFQKLHNQVPHYARPVDNLINSDYCSSSTRLKDCYLCFNGGDSEKILYSLWFKRCFWCIDCTLMFDSRQCFMCVDIENCDTCFYIQNSHHCNECFYCDECSGCQNCFSCSNLHNKKYCIANQQYSREDYFRKVSDITKNTPNVQMLFQQWSIHQPKKHLHLLKAENCIGDLLVNAKDSFYCFECSDVQGLRYCDTIKTGHDCMDISSFGWNPAWSYECASLGHNANHILFCYQVLQDVKDVYYSSFCQTVSDCFWCVWFHSHEHHCILNRPYSVSEYEQLCWKIVDHMRSTGEWWEFFPHELSPFGYNETVAQEYFPLSEEEVRSRGWNWYNAPEKTFEWDAFAPLSVSEYDEKTVWFEKAQKNIDTLLGGVIRCEVTGKPFKIIKQEPAFYIEHRLPIPNKHPDQRHADRMALRNPRELHERICPECQKKMITTYGTDRAEKVVCEECYRKLVY